MWGWLFTSILYPKASFNQGNIQSHPPPFTIFGGYKMQLDPRIGWDLGREIFTSKSGDRAPHLDLKNAQHDGSCRPNIQHCARHLIQIGLQLIMQLSWQKRLGSTNHTSTSSCRARFAHGKKKAPEMEMVPWDSHFNLTEETEKRLTPGRFVKVNDRWCYR